jgi:Amt family ammonium transporter
MKLNAFILLILIALTSVPAALAADPDPTVFTNKEAIDLVQTHANYLWTLVAACLVFFMQAGFALVEAGFTRAKSSINIMMKNLMDFSIGSIAFWAIGFGLMFGASATGWFGTTGFFLSDFTPDGDPWVLAFWMFQVVFAATAATIVSGAMAERTKFTGYISIQLYRIGPDLSDFRLLGLGQPVQRQRLAGRFRLHRFCRLHCGSLGGRLGSPGRCHRPRPPSGKIHQRR